MKKISSIIVLLLLLAAFPASAHMGQVQSKDDAVMRQMMGKEAWESMQDIEEQMMGAENHEKMEILMDKMFAGKLSAQDQQEMLALMQDQKIAAATPMMLMRTGMPQMMSKWGVSGMPGFGMGWWAWGYWITLILIWTVLILGIAALWRYLNPKKGGE